MSIYKRYSEEIWKDIPGCDGYYQVSNNGKLRSIDHYVNIGYGAKRLSKGRELHPVKCKNGYLEAQINYKGERIIFLLHRLVAMVFIENPDNLPEVNHKDENIQNCHVDNLEWCTSKYNANYGTRNARCKEGNRRFEKAVNQYDLSGNFIKRWDCMSDASRHTGADISAMIRVCKGKQNTAVGYKWEYAT